MLTDPSQLHLPVVCHHYVCGPVCTVMVASSVSRYPRFWLFCLLHKSSTSQSVYVCLNLLCAQFAVHSKLAACLE